MTKTLFSSILIFILITGATPTSAADYDLSAGMIPPEYHGRWATPDCAQPENIVLIQNRLILDANPYTNFVSRITDTEKNDNVLKAHFGDMNIYLDKKSDGTIDIANVFLAEEHGTDHPYQNVSPHKRSYMACDSVNANWASADEQALGAFSDIAALEEKCEGAYIEDSPACQQQMFLFADQDINGKLDHQELKRLYKLAVYYSGSASCEFPHIFPGTTKSDSETFATQIIAAMDRDNDQTVTLEDIRNGWDIALLEQPMAEKFMRLTNDLSLLIYSIPHYPYIER